MSTCSFHPTYAGLLAGLPPSQLKEARRRLSSCKQPLTDEELVSEHPRVLACLEKIAASYSRKKGRSAVASKARRDAARELKGDSVEPVLELIGACSLEPVEMVCGEDEEPSSSAVELEDETPPLPPPLRREITEAVAKAPSPAQPTTAQPTTAQPTTAQPTTAQPTTAHAKPSLAEQIRKNKAPPPPPTQSKGRKFFTNQQ